MATRTKITRQNPGTKAPATRAAITFGNIEIAQNVGSYQEECGGEFEMACTFDWNQLPTASLDKLIQEIPAGAICYRAEVFIDKTFTGTGGVLNIGNISRDGTGAVAGAYFNSTTLALASMTAGTHFLGAGSQIGSFPTAANKVLHAAVTAGSFTAGRLTVILTLVKTITFNVS